MRLSHMLLVGGSVCLCIFAPLTSACAEAVSAPSRSSAPVRGVVRALNQAFIGIDLPARVSRLHVREAEAFKKGDPLVTFDCERFKAEHAAVEAASREARLNLKSLNFLSARGAIGKLEVEISNARADKAEAEAAAIAARLKQCVIIAPFEGRVIELKINEHEVPAAGQPFIGLVDETRFEIDLILPSRALRSLTAGTSMRFMIDETGVTYDAKVVRVGATVDPVSQSVKVIAAFVAADRRIAAGMSGTAEFDGLEALR